jgi:hypothetical protein
MHTTYLKFSFQSLCGCHNLLSHNLESQRIKLFRQNESRIHTALRSFERKLILLTVSRSAQRYRPLAVCCYASCIKFIGAVGGMGSNIASESCL